jgi:DNA-binding LacI/PurR family transcriptional regulator
MPTVTMSQIAEAAGVSQATVSFVLNRRARTNGSISAATSKRVLEAAQEMGYRPNRSARALATGHSNLIGLCMWNLAAAHYAGVTCHVEKNLQTSPYHLLVSCLKTKRTEDDPQQFQEVFPWPMDGILALEAANVLSTHMETFNNWPAPIVSMGGTNYEVENLDYVGIDLAAGVRQAVSHLVKIGCRRIAFACAKSSYEAEELRAVAYTKAMQQYRTPTEYIPLSLNSRSTARVDLRNYINEHGCPGGILCFNDEVALGSYRALCDLGIKVPTQVALVGCDGIEDTEYLECPISTIVQPIREMCQLAWKMLQDRISDPQCEVKQKVLVPQLVIRDSTLHFGGKGNKNN